MELPFRFNRIGRWWDKKNEIDIVAFDRQDNIIFGECKWKNSAVSIRELNLLRAKAVNVGGDFSNKYYSLFSKIGFDSALKELAEVDKTIKLIDINSVGEPIQVLLP